MPVLTASYSTTEPLLGNLMKLGVTRRGKHLQGIILANMLTFSSVHDCTLKICIEIAENETKTVKMEACLNPIKRKGVGLVLPDTGQIKG